MLEYFVRPDQMLTRTEYFVTGTDVTRSDAPILFTTATSSGRSVQIGSNSVLKKGPVAIDLFCFLIFTLFVTEI